MMKRRLLTTEPLALDLVDTEWVGEGERQDQLATLEGTQAWLVDHGLRWPGADLHDVRSALLEARGVLRNVLELPEHPESYSTFNALLERGRVQASLAPSGPREDLVIEESWRPAWSAVHNYIQLLREDPHRIRRCANPNCILYFFDISKNGTRRWCDMSICGNREKARRHYRRSAATA